MRDGLSDGERGKSLIQKVYGTLVGIRGRPLPLVARSPPWVNVTPFRRQCFSIQRVEEGKTKESKKREELPLNLYISENLACEIVHGFYHIF